MTKKLQLLAAWLITSIAFGQSFSGLTQDNYSGIHGVIVNPANVQNSPYKVDVNLFSLSVLASTDAFDVDFDRLINDDDYDLFDDDDAKTFNENNNAYIYADILGPSFMFGLSKKSSLAFTSRVRGILNVNGLKGELVDEVDAIDEDLNESFSVTEENATITANSWVEIGATYGREIFSNDRHYLSVGITAKYLQGRGAATAEANDLTVSYQTDGNDATTDERFSANGNVSYTLSEGGYDPDNEDDEYEFDSNGSGFGIDIGAVYEWRKKAKELDSTASKIYKRNYILKVGFAITDIGKITYDGAERENYNFGNTSIDRDTFLNEDLFGVIERLTTPEISSEDLEIKLPTALRLNVDFQATKRLFLNAGINQSLISEDEKNANRILSEYYIAPRFQTKVLTLGTTLMTRQDLGFAWGANLRVGPLVLGSSTLFSGLFGDSSQQADVYVGLKIPVYKRLKAKKNKK